MRQSLLWVAAVVFVIGCDTTNTSNYIFAPDLAVQGGGGGGDGSASGGGCTPNAKECVSNSLARVCPADGASWLAVQCQFGETCMNGDCVPDTQGTPCTSADNFCTGDATALACNANGIGFMMVTCPANTKCVGGQCAGNCVVGQSLCLDPQTVSVCADGQSFTSSACPSGQLCASDGNGGGSCLPSTCTPDSANGCNAACGNRSADAANSDPGFISFCTETPQGWKWISTNCVSPKSCDPKGDICASGSGTQAKCSTECVPGTTRCSSDTQGLQTCDPSTGKWGAITPCDVGTSQVCFFANGTGPAVCGDAPCSVGPGVCVAGGFEACDGSGKLAASPTPCAVGLCVVNGQVNGMQVGQCVTECQEGDSRCAHTAIQTCVGGSWSSSTTFCSDDAGTQGCFNLTTAPPASRPRAVCGECRPGAHRCATSDGNPGSEGSAYLQTCDDTGHWINPPAACTASHCEFNNSLDDEACVADCIPGVVGCWGDPVATPAPIHFGVDGQFTCTADGKMGAVTGCAPGTSCRLDSTHKALGCVVCVSANNENGYTDTRCSSVDGSDFGSAAVQLCNATGTGWLTPVQECGPDGECVDPDSPRQLGPYCHQCTSDAATNINEFDECSDSDLTISTLDFNGETSGCQSATFGWDEGAPTSCAHNRDDGTGAVSDCCASDCYADPPPNPAACAASAK